MMLKKSGPASRPRLASDSPAALGDLAELFVDRNIAVGNAPDGHVLLVRPDSVLIELPDRDDERRESVVELIANYDDSTAQTIRESGDGDAAGFVRVHVAAGRRIADRRGERRLSLDAVNEVLTAAADHRRNGKAAPVRAEYNHVVIGAQTVRGSPLGIQASWADEMAFAGSTTKTADGRTVLLTLADPATEPPNRPDRLDIPGRTPPKVLVLDTGLNTITEQTRTSGDGRRAPAHPALADCHVHDGWLVDKVPGQVDDEDEVFDPPVGVATEPQKSPPSNLLDFEAGHGTFIAGIVKQICPDADVYSAGVLSSFGDGDVDGVIGNFQRVLGEIDEPVDIVIMSFGANLIDDDPGFFGEALARVLGDAVGVAAAGNQSTCRPYFPAALDTVIGVGGLAADGKAWFTNFGGWVDACAPAVDVVSTFFTDFQEVVDGRDTRHYEGWARWSGTSFAAPKVAGLIAQEMYLRGHTAWDAWERMVSHKHFRYPDLGIVFNV